MRIVSLKAEYLLLGYHNIFGAILDYNVVTINVMAYNTPITELNQTK